MPYFLSLRLLLSILKKRPRRTVWRQRQLRLSAKAILPVVTFRLRPRRLELVNQLLVDMAQYEKRPGCKTLMPSRD
jgi:hypothetical protein